MNLALTITRWLINQENARNFYAIVCKQEGKSFLCKSLTSSRNKTRDTKLSFYMQLYKYKTLLG
jgi:hypothetical protein